MSVLAVFCSIMIALLGGGTCGIMISMNIRSKHGMGMYVAPIFVFAITITAIVSIAQI